MEARLLMAQLPPGFTEAVVAENIQNATAMEIAPDGRLWVLEQQGEVKVFRDGSTQGVTALKLPATSIDNRVERGLVGIAFDPSYDIASPAPDYVYLYYTSTASPGPHNRISRFEVDNTDPDHPTLVSETVLVELDTLPDAPYHNGGAMHFGPDGKLYVGTGDSTNPFTSQDLTNRFGKMLRYNADGTIPADNPTSFAGVQGTTSGANRAIWAMGLRNPFTFAIQPGTGRMHINDVGQVLFEEINVGQAGANYGWPQTEGYFDQAAFPGITQPYYSYAHGSGPLDGYAITGGVFYNPSKPTDARFPAQYEGDYFFADSVNSWISVIDAETKAVTRFATDSQVAIDLDVAADGSLLYLERLSGRVFRIYWNNTLAPNVTEQPHSQIIPLGRSATFTVAASGATPLAYQWQRAEAGTQDFVDIPGATSESYSLDNVQASDNGDLFRVVVGNAHGFQVSEAAVLTATSDQLPAIFLSIDAGLVADRFIAGLPISFTVAAVDPEDGVIGPDRISYQVDYITSINSGSPLLRPFVPEVVGQGFGTFTPATTGPYTLTDVVYRITVTATDSLGLSTSITRDIAPNVATMTVTSNPPGFLVTVEGQPYPTPHTFESVVGFEWTLGAEFIQGVAPLEYFFAGWSDGGEAIHRIAAPPGGATYEVVYLPPTPVTLPPDPGTTVNPPAARVPMDFDGDGKTDLAVYHPAARKLTYHPSSAGSDMVASINLPGRGRVVPVVGDFDGDGLADVAAYVASRGVYIYKASGGGPEVTIRIGAGAGRSVPVLGDFDGDGRDDAAVYMRTRGEVRFRPSSGGPSQVISLGRTGRGRAVPVVGDFDGDGRDEAVAYVSAQGGFRLARPGKSGTDFIPLGPKGLRDAVPVPGDYDGDGKTDLAVAIPSRDQLIYRPSSGGEVVVVSLGGAKGRKVPVPGSYSGSGKAEVATFAPALSTFTYRPSADGEEVVVKVGGTKKNGRGTLPTWRGRV